MSHEELTRAFKEATAQPPPFAREKVWNGLQNRPAPSRRGWVLAGALALLAVVVLFPRVSDGQWHEGAVSMAWTAARVERTGNTVQLERGELAISAWGTPVEVHAGAHTIVVERGVAIIQVASDSVTVDLVEGSLLFDGESRSAPRRASTSLSDAAMALDEPPAKFLRLTATAERAEADQRFEDAVKTWKEIASSGSLDAEVANFKEGELELRKLNQPALALATFDSGEVRHPRGALTQERQLSAIESCFALNRWADVAQRTSEFLAAHPESERVQELRALQTRACGELKQPASGCP
jgi:hypothetical protein